MKLLSIFLLSVQAAFGQRIIVSNKADLYLNFGLAVATGQKTYGSSPALIANMKSGITYGATYLQHVIPHVSAGLSVSQTQFSGWQAEGSNLFDGTTTSISSIGPVIALRSRPPVIKRLRTIIYLFSIVPSANTIRTNTSSASSINNGDPPVLLSTQSTRFGMEYRAGAELFLNNQTGLSIQAGYQSIDARSDVFPDEKYAFFTIQAGLVIRLMKDKRYKYSSSLSRNQN